MWRLLKYIRKIVARQRMKQSTNIIRGIMKSTNLAISEIVITKRIWRLIECVPEYDPLTFEK